MTRSRLYDVYFKTGNRWVWQLRTLFPLAVSVQKDRGNIAKNIPCRQWSYSGYNSRVWIRSAYADGCSSGYWRFVESLLEQSHNEYHGYKKYRRMNAEFIRGLKQ